LANHLDGIAEAGRGYGLIGALAAGMGLKVGTEKGFAGCRDVGGCGDEIHVDAAYDYDWFAHPA
jgi:hypothetical protein